MEQVLVGEPSPRHLYTHRLILSRGLTLCSSHCWRPWGKLQKMKAWRRSAQPGQDTVVLMKVPISTPTFWSPDPACPGLLKSKRAGGEAAGVATPDAWERSPPPCRSAPWPAGQGPGEQVRLPQLKSLCVLLLSLGFCCPVTLWGAGPDACLASSALLRSQVAPAASPVPC